MSAEMVEAIRGIMESDSNISENMLKETIENFLLAAYKCTYGTTENAVVKFSEDMSDVSLYSRKVILDGIWDPSVEIELEDALKLSPDCEEGDEIDILIDPAKEFSRKAIQTGKQAALQALRDIKKDGLYLEWKEKLGQIITCYFQRERNGNIYVDLKNVEGILPKKFQSPRDAYSKDNKQIKALVTELKKTKNGLQVVLSRTESDFVRCLLENDVPEISDKIVEIHKIVREPGYRTKVAVYTSREDIDPVGACVGLKGTRIQAVIGELDGEKVDVLKYDSDPRVFIKNALSPAEVSEVYILDEDKRQALAVVTESQFSLAIGKQGLNVRLANRLVDWSIDVKTDDQTEEIEALTAESRKAVNDLFSNEQVEDYAEINTVSDLPGVDSKVVAALKAASIDTIEEYLDAYDSGSLSGIEGVTEEELAKLHELVNSVVEFVEEESAEPASETSAEEQEEAAPAEEEVYECPECGARITLDMTACPNCGVELSFEYEDEE